MLAHHIGVTKKTVKLGVSFLPCNFSKALGEAFILSLKTHSIVVSNDGLKF